MFAAATDRRYQTNFPFTQNPLSEGGNWITGHAVGLDWLDVQSNGSFCYAGGAQAKNFNDSIACLSGTWSANHVVVGKARTVNKLSGSIANEIELHLRRTITAHSSTGYEVDFSVRPKDGTQYIELVRWDGAVGSFTVSNGSVVGPSVQDGDICSAGIAGNIVTISINGVTVMTADITTAFNGGDQWINGVDHGTTSSNGTVFNNGSPGIGVDYGGLSTDLITDQGWYSWVGINNP